mgnify:CR=1 FL=1
MSTPFFIPWADIRPGDQARMDVVMDEQKVNAFSGVIGDTDSFHVSDAAAAATVFQKRICHGVHLLAYVSVAIGRNLPGFGTIYCSHSFSCHAPVYVGDTITVSITVLEKRPHHRLLLETDIHRADGILVLSGQAEVKTYR